MAKELHRWWVDRPDEIFWLEVTDRTDPGQNLKAPQTNEKGGDFWSYSLVRHVRRGNVIFHYDRPSQRIIGSSRATGDHWADQIVWAARGTSAREAGITPHARPGWYTGLEGFSMLESPLPLAEIRSNTTDIQRERDALEQSAGSPLYFPFEPGRKRPIRPMQGYLFKLPAFFVRQFDSLAESTRVPPTTTGALVREKKLGSEYRPADEELSVGEFDPMAVDPAVVERGTRGHARTQNHLAQFLRTRGIDPRSPTSSEPSFDLGWLDRGQVWVAEVKSITDRNEERQLRMGLGQVLQYRHVLAQTSSAEVVAVLALERRPPASWIDLCSSLGVKVVWDGDFEALAV